VTAIEWVAAVLLLVGVAGVYFAYVRFMRPLQAPDPALRQELRALGKERRRGIARAIAEGRVVEDPEDARLALGAYERSRAWNQASSRLVVFGLPAAAGGVLLAIDLGSVFFDVVLGCLGCVQVLVAAAAWRRFRRGDRWAAATRAHHAR